MINEYRLCYANGVAIAERAALPGKEPLMTWTNSDGTPDRRKIEFVADRMDVLRRAAHAVTGLAAWARTSDISLLENLLAPVEQGSRFYRVLVETSDGGLLVDLIGEMYRHGVLSTRSCMFCTCLGGGVLVRTSGPVISNTGHPAHPGRFGPLPDVAFYLAFAAPTPSDGIAQLAALHELRDAHDVGPAAPAGPDPDDPLAPPR